VLAWFRGMSSQKQASVRSENTPEAVRKFMLRAVHDLREPLRTIRASSELLAALGGDPASDEKRQRGLLFIQQGVDRLDRLIRDLAEYCHTVVHEPPLAATDLNVVLHEAKAQIADELKRCQAVVTHDPLPRVTADFSALAIVFRALIGNACKYRGDAAPRIHIGVASSDSEWVFSIQDNGRGFDPAYADLIFEPFERLGGNGSRGSGLGLAHSRRIVHRHGGRIGADSKPGEGSTFWFTLPLELPPAAG
jgi:signal transduction histidine kinase